ncbi:MAG: glycosyltransferase family 9 protein [Bacteroidota bacterium]
MKLPEHILVIRLSAPGDVAMTVPILHSFQKTYPGVRLTILTNKRLAPLFINLHANLFFAETKTEHKGFTGLFNLVRQLRGSTKDKRIDAVADLHNVLRSQIIRRLFRMGGIKTAHVDKGRKEKKELTRKENKILTQLPSTFDRYRNVFKELGFDFRYDFTSVFPVLPILTENILLLTGVKKRKWIGIAPFAAYREKMYPFGLMQEAVEELYKRQDTKLIFFGSAEDARSLIPWSDKYKDIVIAAGKLNLADELILLSHLDVMISMDSANMHFASLVNVPVVSVWGATHLFAGFMGWHQSIENAAQVDLYCRPCSVFGNKRCYRGDHACMNLLSPLTITGKAVRILNE